MKPKNIATDETPKAITPYHFFGYFSFSATKTKSSSSVMLQNADFHHFKSVLWHKLGIPIIATYELQKSLVADGSVRQNLKIQTWVSIDDSLSSTWWCSRHCKCHTQRNRSQVAPLWEYLLWIRIILLNFHMSLWMSGVCQRDDVYCLICK